MIGIPVSSFEVSAGRWETHRRRPRASRAAGADRPSSIGSGEYQSTRGNEGARDMCDAGSDPSTYDTVTPQRPKAYVLSGQPVEPKPSVALAVLGEMLNDAENDLEGVGRVTPERDWYKVDIAEARLITLREARDRIAKAELAADGGSIVPRSIDRAAFGLDPL